MDFVLTMVISMQISRRCCKQLLPEVGGFSFEFLHTAEDYIPGPTVSEPSVSVSICAPAAAPPRDLEEEAAGRSLASGAAVAQV